MKLKISPLIFFVLFLPTVTAITAGDYLNEFNNPGETCEIYNYFYYYVSQPKFLDTERHVLTIPIFYKCCKDDKCTLVIFDIQNQGFPNDEYLSELFDLNYINKQLESGELSEDIYTIETSFNICDYFGVDTLRQESVNLGAEGAQSVAPHLDKKEKEYITISLKRGKLLGLIKNLNPSALISSAVCYVNEKDLKKVLEQLAECRSYLANINKNIAVEEYTANLKTCNSDATEKLKKYVDSDLSKIKNVINKAGNVVTGLISFFSEFVEDPISKDLELEIKETEYEYAKQAYNKISNQNPKLIDEEKNELINTHNDRIAAKYSETSNKLDSVQESLIRISQLRPNWLNFFIINVFKEPNYNLSKYDLLISGSKESLTNRYNLLKQFKFNSAFNGINEIEENNNEAFEIIEREINIVRHIDKRWKIFFFSVMAFIIVMVLIVYFILRKNSVSLPQ